MDIACWALAGATGATAGGGVRTSVSPAGSATGAAAAPVAFAGCGWLLGWSVTANASRVARHDGGAGRVAVAGLVVVDDGSRGVPRAGGYCPKAIISAPCCQRRRRVGFG